MKKLKKIGLLLGLSLVVTVLLNLSLLLIMGGFPFNLWEILVGLIIINSYAIYNGWHESFWKIVVSKEVLTEEEDFLL